MKEMSGIEAAKAFINKLFPNCMAAILAGSVARGEERPNSDLDIIIIEDNDIEPYRKSYREYGWFIEVFVGSKTYYKSKVEHPNKKSSPSSLTALAEGIVIKDSLSFADKIKDGAINILNEGPDPLTEEDKKIYRYIITDWLDDFTDAKEYEESIFIAYDLFSKAAELLLANSQKWIGERKWLYRSLTKLNNKLSKDLIDGLVIFYKSGNKDEMQKAIISILDLVGGKLYEGFSRRG